MTTTTLLSKDQQHKPFPTPHSGKQSFIKSSTWAFLSNTNISSAFYDKWLQLNEGWLQPNWVGDLTVSCRVDVASIAAALCRSS